MNPASIISSSMDFDSITVEESRIKYEESEGIRSNLRSGE